MWTEPIGYGTASLTELLCGSESTHLPPPSYPCPLAAFGVTKNFRWLTLERERLTIDHFFRGFKSRSLGASFRRVAALYVTRWYVSQGVKGEEVSSLHGSGTKGSDRRDRAGPRSSLKIYLCWPHVYTLGSRLLSIATFEGGPWECLRDTAPQGRGLAGCSPSTQ